MKLVDSHCHLDDRRFADDLDSVVERAQAAGIEFMVSIGTGDGPPDLEAGIRMAERFACVYATVGIHPHDAAKSNDAALKQLESLARHPKVVAIGEIGLDYHYDNSPFDVQRDVFAAQMDIAARAAKPIVIHTREAWGDTFSALERHWQPARGGIMHCFSGGAPEGARSVALGFHLSFAGILTYSNSDGLQEAARAVPVDRMLVETDAPYLAPVPYRGRVKRNEPAFVVETARKLAELRGETLEFVAQTTSRNWHELVRASLREVA